jgi:phage-related protein
MKCKKITWLESSRDDLRSFPKTVRKRAGTQLRFVELGLEPTDWKPMASIGPGVRAKEINRDEFNTVANTG